MGPTKSITCYHNKGLIDWSCKFNELSTLLVCKKRKRKHGCAGTLMGSDVSNFSLWGIVGCHGSCPNRKSADDCQDLDGSWGLGEWWGIIDGTPNTKWYRYKCSGDCLSTYSCISPAPSQFRGQESKLCAMNNQCLRCDCYIFIQPSVPELVISDTGILMD